MNSHQPTWNRFSLGFLKKGFYFVLMHLSMSWMVIPSIRTFILQLCGIEFANRKSVFVGTDVLFDLSDKIFIGEGVTITTGTKIMTHYFDPIKKSYKKGAVRIEDGVFIGMNTLIVNSVTIENNTTVGAGSVVTKDITSNAIAGGVPAKVIKKL